MDYEIIDREGGKGRYCVVVELKKGEEGKLVNLIKTNEIDELHMAMEKIEADFEFFQELSHIKALYLVGDISDKEASYINYLRNLEVLYVTRAPANDKIIDFSNLVKLRKLRIGWWKGAKNISALENLEELIIGMHSHRDQKYDGKDFSEFSTLRNLRKLILEGGSDTLRSLRGIEGMPNLEVLHLTGWNLMFKLVGRQRDHRCKKLQDIEEIKAAKNLQELYMKVKKLNTLKPLAELKNLRKLRINIEEIVDKNIYYLLDLPKLEDLTLTIRSLNISGYGLSDLRSKRLKVKEKEEGLALIYNNSPLFLNNNFF